MHRILIVEGNLPNENKNFQNSGIQTHAESLKESLSYYTNDLKIDVFNPCTEKTFDKVMANVKFLPNVIKYDRYQPEFYEDTKTYITKRTSNKKVSKGVNFYNENKSLIKLIECKYNIENELLLSLMGI